MKICDQLTNDIRCLIHIFSYTPYIAFLNSFEVLKQFIDYTSALTEANNTDARKGEQISIWETDEETLDVLNSWIIKEHYE